MCGIAGFNFRVDREFVFNRLYHRGPDERGYFEDKFFSFFHTRLSIQDISEGHQPFFYKNYLIIFNGEIYNHLELRNLLKEFNFKTHSDTETLLYLYIKFKEEMFKYIDGMFAFCIYDTNKKELLLARDRVGKKPLYIYQKGKKFGFASEINVLKNLYLTIDENDMNLFLSTGFCESGYKEIKEFLPGYYAKCKMKNGKWKIEFKRYFNVLDYFDENVKNENEALELIDEILEKSVKTRLLSSDVEVGAFLSGGIDSNLIVAKVSKFKKIKTFTVRFPGEFDETPLANLTAKRYETEHKIIDVSVDFDEIVKIVSNYGKPFFDSSAIPSYFVSRAARKEVKVILNGDGADELFAGYRRYLPLRYGFDKVVKNFSFILPLLNPQKRGVSMFIYRLIRASKKEGIHWYNVMLNDLFEDLYEFNGEKINEIDTFIKSVKLNNFNKLLYLDFVLNLRYGLLMKMDIATMSNSLEGRSPFLSKYFLEFAYKINRSLKIKNFKTKYILRKLAEKYLDEKVVKAKKRGFEIPLTKWVNNEMKDMIMDYLNYGFYKNFVDVSLIDKIINRKINIPEDKRAKILYLLFTLEVWNENRIS